MDRDQVAQVNSIAGSDDFCDDRAADLVSVPQIAIEAAKLKTELNKILDADAIGSRNNEGVAVSKQTKRNNLETIYRKVGKAGGAFFYSIGEEKNTGITSPTASELQKMSTEEILIRTRDLYNICQPHAAVLIGADAADLTALNAAKEALADEWNDPKRAIQISKIQNDAIPGYIKNAMKIRQGIDIYMQTFEDDQPLLYAEWKLTLSIDDAQTFSNPDLSTPPISCGGTGVVTTIDFAPLVGEFTGSTNIKFFLPDIVGQGMSAGFGADANTINTPLPLAAGANPRVTAASLGYNIDTARFLNVRNNTAAPVMVRVEFYLED